MFKTMLTIAATLALVQAVQLPAAYAATGGIGTPGYSSSNYPGSPKGGAGYRPAGGWDGNNPFPNHNEGGLPAHNGGAGTTKGGSYNPTGAVCCSSSSGGGDYKGHATPQLTLPAHIPPKIHGPFPGPYPDPLAPRKIQ
jgi:hypothetical protein